MGSRVFVCFLLQIPQLCQSSQFDSCLATLLDGFDAPEIDLMQAQYTLI
jgi:hypothetical protein